MTAARSAYFAVKRSRLDSLGRSSRLERLPDPLSCSVCGTRLRDHPIKACWRDETTHAVPVGVV